MWLDIEGSVRVARYEVLVQPSGCINGQPWPEVGGTLEVAADLSGMVEAGLLKPVKPKVEKRPATRKGVEAREV